MAENPCIEIVSLDRLDGDAIIVGFSDGTLTNYTVAELLALRPNREQASEESGPDES